MSIGFIEFNLLSNSEFLLHLWFNNVKNIFYGKKGRRKESIY